MFTPLRCGFLEPEAGFGLDWGLPFPGLPGFPSADADLGLSNLGLPNFAPALAPLSFGFLGFFGLRSGAAPASGLELGSNVGLGAVSSEDCLTTSRAGRT